MTTGCSIFSILIKSAPIDNENILIGFKGWEMQLVCLAWPFLGNARDILPPPTPIPPHAGGEPIIYTQQDCLLISVKCTYLSHKVSLFFPSRSSIVLGAFDHGSYNPPWQVIHTHIHCITQWRTAHLFSVTCGLALWHIVVNIIMQAPSRKSSSEYMDYSEWPGTPTSDLWRPRNWIFAHVPCPSRQDV